MKIVILNKNQFDDYSNNHPLHTYFQSSMYGDLMEKTGFKVDYYGFTDDNNNLIGATLMITQKLIGSHKFAYCPRGFLLDYENRDLLNEVTQKFKKYLSRQKFVFLKIDPPVINNKRDQDGNIIPSPYSNDTIPFLQKIGYTYYGENRFFGTLKPRWNAILKLSGTSESLFNNFDKNVKNKIRKAESRGIEVVQGNIQDLEVFYSFIAKKHYRKLNYYKALAEAFKDKFELYFARLNTNKYLENIKVLYNEETQINEELNSQIQTGNLNGNSLQKLTNKKLTSDKLIAIYKKELDNATELFQKKPNGIIIGVTSIIVQNNHISMLIEGLNPTYSLFYPTYLTKWCIIDKYSKMSNMMYFDMNAITGYFSDNNKFRGLNEMKLGFNSEVTEYVGEFDLIINQFMYSLYSSTKVGNRNLKGK